MTMMSRSYLVIAYMFLMMILIPLSLGLNKCKLDEQQSLLKFKQSITKDPMNRLSSWVDNDDCCIWHGVRCDADTGHVIELDLRNLLLSRYDYYQDLQTVDCSSKSVAALTSPVLDSALLGLTELARLDLSWNNFRGSQIPGFIGSFRQLRYLNLSEAGFSGHIPPQLGHLSNLVLLDVSSFQCEDTSSSTSLSWASNLSMLQTVNMDSVDLSQASDAMTVLSRLESLTMLSLSNCRIVNTHNKSNLHMNSSTSFFGALKHLDLSSNSFEGRRIPSIIRNISSLVSLSLGSNFFKGSFPLWLTTLPLLEVLDLSYNEFSDMDVTNVWRIMGNPCSFKHLNLNGNYIEGQILEPSTNFSKCDTYNLEYLDLGGNEFGGTLPSFLGQLKKMKYLDLSVNEFQGVIPSSLAGLSALKYLDLSDNQLTGSTQDFLGNFTEIEFLDLSSLTLHGTVSSTIANFSKLTSFDLSCDNLNLDPILDWRPRFQLKLFNMLSCGRLTVIPQWLKNQTQMESLDLSDNSMTGEFPNWLWNMTSLNFLNLSYNLLSGSITNLSPNLDTLDLSNNFLRGPLPEHHINCHQLQSLDLHNNKFSGSIPSWLVHLQFIEFIDLSTNQLTGKVFEENNGSSLLMSPNLGIIDFSDNELSGKILFDSRVQHWDIYTGNQGLCGFPLNQCYVTPHATSEEGETNDEEEEDDGHEKMWFYIVIMAGIATGFWGVVGTLVVKKRWREAYFGFVEDIMVKFKCLS